MPTFGPILIKIDSDTNFVASTGTSCEDQPPRKKQKLSASSTSPCSHTSSASSSSAIVSSINIAGKTTTVNEQRYDKTGSIDNPSTSCGDFGALAKMQEQETSNSNGKLMKKLEKKMEKKEKKKRMKKIMNLIQWMACIRVTYAWKNSRKYLKCIRFTIT